MADFSNFLRMVVCCSVELAVDKWWIYIFATDRTSVYILTHNQLQNGYVALLYTYPELDPIERRVLNRIDELQRDLRHFVVQDPKRWTGILARMTRARALRASNSIENINVSQEDAVAAVDGEDPAETDRQTWRAVVGYQQAMTYILQRCRDHDFQFSVDAILAIHFMISQSDLDANPGNFRRGWVGVRNTRTNEVVHEGVSRDRLEENL